MGNGMPQRPLALGFLILVVTLPVAASGSGPAPAEWTVDAVHAVRKADLLLADGTAHGAVDAVGLLAAATGHVFTLDGVPADIGLREAVAAAERAAGADRGLRARLAAALSRLPRGADPEPIRADFTVAPGDTVRLPVVMVPGEPAVVYVRGREGARLVLTVARPESDTICGQPEPQPRPICAWTPDTAPHVIIVRSAGAGAESFQILTN